MTEGKRQAVAACQYSRGKLATLVINEDVDEPGEDDGRVGEYIVLSVSSGKGGGFLWYCM